MGSNKQGYLLLSKTKEQTVITSLGQSFVTRAHLSFTSFRYRCYCWFARVGHSQKHLVVGRFSIGGYLNGYRPQQTITLCNHTLLIAETASLRSNRLKIWKICGLKSYIYRIHSAMLMSTNHLHISLEARIYPKRSKIDLVDLAINHITKLCTFHQNNLRFTKGVIPQSDRLQGS